MPNTRISRGLAFAIAFLALTFAPRGASAVITISLDTPNAAISGYTGPYGTVSVVFVDATHATVSLMSNTVGTNIYLFGDGSTIALNTNGTATASGIMGANAGSGFSPGPFTQTSPVPHATQQVNGFGKFNMVIDDFDGFSNTVDSLSFTLTKGSGTWADESAILTPNANGARAAGHVFVAPCTGTPCVANQSTGALTTGFASGSGGPIRPTEVSVPEASTFLFFGAGLLGLLAPNGRLAKL